MSANSRQTRVLRQASRVRRWNVTPKIAWGCDACPAARHLASIRTLNLKQRWFPLVLKPNHRKSERHRACYFGGAKGVQWQCLHPIGSALQESRRSRWASCFLFVWFRFGRFPSAAFACRHFKSCNLWVLPIGYALVWLRCFRSTRESADNSCN